MRKINLKAKGYSGSSGKRKYSSQTSLIVGIILLMLAACLYGGVSYVKNKQVKKIDLVKNEITSMKNSLDSSDDFKVVYDFQDRLLELKDITKNKVVQLNLLNQISETTMNRSVIQDLKVVISDGLSDVEVIATITDLDILAKQLNAYGQININKQALLKSSSLKEEGVEAKISFSVEGTSLQSDETEVSEE